MRIDANRPAKVEKLSHIKPPLAQLNLGNEGLAQAKARTQINLRDARRFARLNQQRDDPPIMI